MKENFKKVFRQERSVNNAISDGNLTDVVVFVASL